MDQRTELKTVALKYLENGHIYTAVTCNSFPKFIYSSIGFVYECYILSVT